MTATGARARTVVGTRAAMLQDKQKALPSGWGWGGLGGWGVILGMTLGPGARDGRRTLNECLEARPAKTK